MFELFLMIGIGSIVVCFLKGHRLYGTLTLVGGGVAVVGGTILSDQTGSFIPALVGLLMFTGAAIFGAFRPALSGSVWRRSATVESGSERGPAKQPTSRRVLRAGVGAILGTLPAVLFVFGILTVGTVLGWSSDTLQISFVAIPFLPLGIIVGAIIGYQWVPRKSTGQPTVVSSEGADETPAVPRNRVFAGGAVGVLIGAILVVVDMATGITQGMVFVGPLVLIISGAIGAWWGSRHSVPPGATTA
jgi:hypothetical protein